MKRWMSLLLCAGMLLSLLTGCGAPAEETQMPTQTEHTMDPGLLSMEVLPADVRLAYGAGLVTKEQLKDLDRTVTVGEAAALLQKAQTHRSGVESRVLADLMAHETFAARNADRAWLMGIPALVDLELAYPDHYVDYEQWAREAPNIKHGALELQYSFAKRLGMGVYMIGNQELRDKKSAWDMVYDADGREYILNAWGIIIDNDPDDAAFEKEADGLYVTDGAMLGYALLLHDGTTGKKYMQMEDGRFHPFRELTFGEVVESALRLYNAPNPLEHPEYVPVEEVGKYNEAIITPDLLTKETDLPEASCARLPSEWHGVVMEDLQITETDTVHQDAQVYEYEIQAVKDAGFNYIGLYLDFSWLQDYILFQIESPAFEGMVDHQDKGKVNLKRLEQLDQIIAWCMERDIHVDLRACALPNMNQDLPQGMYWQLDFNGKEHAQKLADMWQAIARRYADIPNEYLSFTLFSMDCAADAGTLLPSVDSIRAESPDRCIIAEMNSYKIKAEPFAEKGVALSSRLFDYEDASPILNHSDCLKWNGVGNYWDATCLETVGNFSWPHEGTVDALTLMSSRRWAKIPSTMDVISVAEEYGVGCMLGDFGVRFGVYGSLDGVAFPRFRYPLDAYKAMIQDIVTSAQDLGLGWCFASWYSPYGVAFGAPLFDDTTYIQLKDYPYEYPYYIDQTILGWFQELNGLKEPA